ncbi:hypothetical protein AB0425_12655 [Actinosynnema sp. NPDC051121]|nr:hypothetical protein [Saccharothrix sp.]
MSQPHQYGVATGGASVVQAGRDANLTVLHVDSDSDVAALAAATTHVWHKANWTWDLDADAPVKVQWDGPGGSGGKPALLSAGLVTRLHEEVYSRLGSGGVVVISGPPGIGKSTAMLLLLDEAIRRRNVARFDATGAFVPVPVWLTLGDWDPERTSLSDYAAGMVATLLDPSRRRKSLPGNAWRLVSERRVALFLDGLDEMPPGRRADAARQIEKLGRDTRIVLTVRPPKRRPGRLTELVTPATTVLLRPVDAATAADFLVRTTDGKAAPPSLHEVAAHVRTNRGSVVAKALTTPLAIALAKDALSGEGARIRLADLVDLASPREVVTHLVGRFLDRAYSVPDLPGRRARKREMRRNARERAFVTWVAARMGTTTDLVWWRMPTWMPIHVLRVRTAAVVSSVTLVIMVAGTEILGSGPGPWWMRLLPAGVTYLLADFNVKRALGRPPAMLAWRWPDRRHLLRVLAIGALGGTIVGAVVTVRFTVWAGLAVAGVFLVAGFLGAGMGDNVAGGLLASSTKRLANSPLLTPVDAYRVDRRRTVVAAVTGCVVGGGLHALLTLFDRAPMSSALWGLTICLALGWVASMGAGWFVALARPALPGVRGLAISPMATLQRAVERKVLRQAGIVYQFRHAALQNYLRGIPVDGD